MKSPHAGLGWRRDTPDIRDLSFEPEVTSLPPVVDLRATFGDFPVFDQGQLGSCTANAISAAIVFAERVEAGTDATPRTTPARLGIYYYERALEGTIDSDSGAEIRDGLKVVAKRGYVDELLWPYDISTFTREVRPIQPGSAEHVIRYHRVAQNLAHMHSCLAQGFPFVFGISVYSSFMDAGNGVIPMPSASEQLEGGHAILCVGYDVQAQRFSFRNSWGPEWGQQGYGTIPFEYLTDPNLGGDYWTVRKET